MKMNPLTPAGFFSAYLSAKSPNNTPNPSLVIPKYSIAQEGREGPRILFCWENVTTSERGKKERVGDNFTIHSNHHDGHLYYYNTVMRTVSGQN